MTLFFWANAGRGLMMQRHYLAKRSIQMTLAVISVAKTGTGLNGCCGVAVSQQQTPKLL